MHGARDRAWNYTLDGIDVNDSSQGGSETTSFRVNPDMLSEMRVLTGNTTAEYGRNSGGQVAMVTRSGTNEFHGNGFWFYRTPRLNANEWENNLDNVGKAQLQQNIFGGGIGGPIVKNKTFFFFQIQALRARSSTLTTRTVYTAAGAPGHPALREGRPQPARRRLRERPSTTSGNVAARAEHRHLQRGRQRSAEARSRPQHPGHAQEHRRCPTTSPSATGSNTAGFNFTPLASERQHDQTIKIDHVINSKNNVYGRLAWGRDDSICDIVNGGQPVFPGEPCLVNTLRGPRNFAFNWRFTPNARMTNELVVGQNRYDPIFGQPSSLDKISIASAPVATTWQYYFGNRAWSAPGRWWTTSRTSAARTASSSASTCAACGRKTSAARWPASMPPRRSTSRPASTPSIRPPSGCPSDLNTSFDRPNFQSNINFLLGRIGQIDRGFVAQGRPVDQEHLPVRHALPGVRVLRPGHLEGPAESDRRLRPALGNPPRRPARPSNNILVPNQPIVAGAAPSSNVQWVPGKLFKNQMGNFGPSLGFAWDPFKTGKTSIRGNYRIAYDRINMFVIASHDSAQPAGRARIAAINQDFGQAGGRLRNLPDLNPPSAKPSTLTQPAAFAAASNTVIDPNLKTPAHAPVVVQHPARDRQEHGARYRLHRPPRATTCWARTTSTRRRFISNGFLDAFKTIKAGGESALVNNLLKADTRLNAGETASAMIRRLFASNLNLNSVGSAGRLLGHAAAVRAERHRGCRPGSRSSSFPFPQYSSGLNVLDSNDFSTYHALEVQVERRFSNGISFQVSYTWAKSLDTRSFDPTLTVVGTGNASTAGSTPFDINNRRLNYAPSDFDRRHSLQGNFVVRTAVRQGQALVETPPRMLNRVAGGWEVTGFGA